MRNRLEATVLSMPEVCPECGSSDMYDPNGSTPYCEDCGATIAYVWTGKVYIKPAYQPMRPYVTGEDLTGVSVSPEDIPEEGGMIAYNANNFKDKWYVGKEFFAANYNEVEA